MELGIYLIVMCNNLVLECVDIELGSKSLMMNWMFMYF